MRLKSGGIDVFYIDVFYIDESHDQRFYVMSAVTVPFLRDSVGGWEITWPDHLKAAKQWRRAIKDVFGIPVARELHGITLVSGRGKYLKGKFNFPKPKATSVYRQILKHLDMAIEPASVISVAAKTGGSQLYGRARLDACLYALLQRMRKQCVNRRTNGLVFFDQGHPEYRKLYRQAQVFFPTGSRLGAWSSGGSSKDLPLDMFTKDGNEKNSKFCFFTQIADLVAYAAFLKMKDSAGVLEPWQAKYKLGTLYDEIPQSVINARASNIAPRDGIVRLL